MDAPPPLSEPESPFNRRFYILFFSPIASMAVGALISLASPPNSGLQGFGFIVSLATLLAMLVCSILCSIMVGKRKGGGLGFLAFLGSQVIYIAVAFGGCAAAFSNVSFH